MLNKFLVVAVTFLTLCATSIVPAHAAASWYIELSKVACGGSTMQILDFPQTATGQSNFTDNWRKTWGHMSANVGLTDYMHVVYTNGAVKYDVQTAEVPCFTGSSNFIYGKPTDKLSGQYKIGDPQNDGYYRTSMRPCSGSGTVITRFSTLTDALYHFSADMYHEIAGNQSNRTTIEYDTYPSGQIWLHSTTGSC